MIKNTVSNLTIIASKKKLLEWNDFKEVWQARELILVFAWRDLRVRYRQTFLGIAWVLFQPVVTTAIFSIFFGKLAKIPSGNLPYPLFSYSGLILWNFFTTSLSTSSNSIISMGSIIQKIYFPRFIAPLAPVVTNLVDLIVSFIPLILMLIYYQTIPNPLLILFFPFLIILLLLNILGLGFFLSAINVRYRDIRFLLPFFIQIGMFVTPVIYPLGIIYDYRKWFLIINPLTGIFESFRTLISGGSNIDFGLLFISTIMTVFVFMIGLLYFSYSKDQFADYI